MRVNETKPQTHFILYLFLIMSSFFSNARRQDTSAPVTLVVGPDMLELSYDQYNAKSVSQLFGEYGHTLSGGDVSRISEYQVDGEIVPGTFQARPGETVRGVVNTDGKG